MPVTKEDKILIKNLFVHVRRYNAKHLVREFPAKAVASSSCYKTYRLLGQSTIIPAVADNARVCIADNT